MNAKPLKSLKPEDISQTERMYDLYQKTYHMQDGWLPGNKRLNFTSMLVLPQLTGVPLLESSCLDVGCGSGDLVPALRMQEIAAYTGIDVLESSIARARRRYPGERFIHDDFLAWDAEAPYDYVFSSGAMTVRIPSGNYPFFTAMVTKMRKLSRIGVVFNVLTDDDPFPDPDLFFYSPARVSEICRSIDPHATVTIENSPGVAQIHVYMYGW